MQNESFIQNDFSNDFKSLLKQFVCPLAKVNKLEFTNIHVNNSLIEFGIHTKVYLPNDAIDLSQIIDRLTKQREKLQKEVDKLRGMLSNERFVANAPEAVIAENRNGLANAEDKISKITAQIDILKLHN